MALLVAENHLLGLVCKHDTNVDKDLRDRFEWLSPRVPSPADWYMMRAEQALPPEPPLSAKRKSVEWLTMHVHNNLDLAVVIQLPQEWTAKASAVQQQPQQQPQLQLQPHGHDPRAKRRK